MSHMTRSTARQHARIAKKEGKSPFNIGPFLGVIIYMSESKEYKVKINGDDYGSTTERDSIPRLLAGFDPETAGIEEEELLDVEDSDDIEENQDPMVDAPYEFTKARVLNRQVTVGQLVNRIESGGIDLAPPYQRNEGVWRPLKKRRSLLIESLLLGVPIPSLCFEEDSSEVWLPVDGLQRLSALKAFILDDMPLKGMEYLTQLNGKLFRDLDPRLQRRIEESPIAITLIENGTPTELKVLVFQRFNTGSVSCNAQEVRNAVMRGDGTLMINRIADGTMFERATAGSVSSLRMADRQMVLRATSFILSNWDEYNGKMKAHLTNTLQILNQMNEDDLAEVEARVCTALDRAFTLFGDHAFRKIQSEARSPINRSLFEAQMSALDELTQEEFEKLMQKRKQIIGAFRLVCEEDDEFNAVLSQGTGHVASVSTRHQVIRNLFLGALRTPKKSKK